MEREVKREGGEVVSSSSIREEGRRESRQRRNSLVGLQSILRVFKVLKKHVATMQCALDDDIHWIIPNESSERQLIIFSWSKALYFSNPSQLWLVCAFETWPKQWNQRNYFLIQKLKLVSSCWSWCVLMKWIMKVDMSPSYNSHNHHLLLSLPSSSSSPSSSSCWLLLWLWLSRAAWLTGRQGSETWVEGLLLHPIMSSPVHGTHHTHTGEKSIWDMGKATPAYYNGIILTYTLLPGFNNDGFQRFQSKFVAGICSFSYVKTCQYALVAWWVLVFVCDDDSGYDDDWEERVLPAADWLVRSELQQQQQQREGGRQVPTQLSPVAKLPGTTS